MLFKVNPSIFLILIHKDLYLVMMKFSSKFLNFTINKKNIFD